MKKYLPILTILFLSACGGGDNTENLIEAKTPQSVIDTQLLENTTKDIKVYPSYKVADADTISSSYTPEEIKYKYNIPQYTKDSIDKFIYGYGETMYIVSGYYNSHLIDEVNAYSEKYNLPKCEIEDLNTLEHIKSYKVNNTCKIFRIILNDNGDINTLNKDKIANDKNWTLETSINVQLAHSIAPEANIVLIEMSSPTVLNVMKAVDLIEKMPAGIVSLSLGAPEDEFVKLTLPKFNIGSEHTYVASSSSSKSVANWPAVLPSVLSISGTSIDKNLNETAWSENSATVSKYIQKPVYQNTINSFRVNADMSWNANPNTGQPVMIWNSYLGIPTKLIVGGTSLGTSQISGVLTLANALRKKDGKKPIGYIHDFIYSHPENFVDIKNTDFDNQLLTGYDIYTGIGVPNSLLLINSLTIK